MLVHRATNFPRLVKTYWRQLAIVMAIVLVSELANELIKGTSLDFQTLGLMTAALSIFLVFRVNEAYSRWWEARMLWGGIVNASRTFARQATTLLTAPDDSVDLSTWQRELVYRQLAYVNALRIGLRRQEDWSDLARLLPPEELASVQQKANKATFLLHRQGERIAEARRLGLLQTLDLMMIDSTLTEFYALQGGCERIKNTVFPDRVAYITQFTAWSLAVLVPLCVIQVNQRWDPIDLIIVPAIVMGLVITERIGAELKNPFENRPNDTPMTALCRTIEIDLREQLKESDLPTPLEPVGGVLM